MVGIGIGIIMIEVFIFLGVIAALVYLIVKRIEDRGNETFEHRDN